MVSWCTEVHVVFVSGVVISSLCTGLVADVSLFVVFSRCTVLVVVLSPNDYFLAVHRDICLCLFQLL